MPESAWYYAQQQRQFGPIATEALVAMLQSGQVFGTDLVWKQGMATWVPASTIQEFATPAMQGFQRQMPNMYAPQPVDTSGKATASMVLGIIGLVMWLCPLIGLGVSIPGLVLGMKGRTSIYPGRAKAGIIMSIIGLVLTAANMVFGVLVQLGAIKF